MQVYVRVKTLGKRKDVLLAEDTRIKDPAILGQL